MGTLQSRLFLTYFVIIGVTLGLTALSLFLLLGGYREAISYGNLEDLATLINQQALAEVDPEAADGQAGSQDELLTRLSGFLNQRDATAGATDIAVAVTNATGTVVARAGIYDIEGVVIDELTETASESGPQRCRMGINGGGELLCVSIPISPQVVDQYEGTEAAAIVVAQPAAGLGEVFGDLMPRLLFSGIIGVVAALVLGFLLSQSVAAPLRNIARAARSVARGNYRQRVPATGPREVRDLATNFNRMTEEVQRSQQTLRDFLANISHELKTPLTSIRGFGTAIADGTIDDPAGITRSATIICDESNRVLRLVEELLDLSRIESGQVSMRQEDVDLTELLEHVHEVFALRSEENGVAVEVESVGNTRIRGDYDRLEQVLNNLLDNALRHTPRGGTVRVQSREVQQGLVQVAVTDNGPGIPQDDIPHLFERFYRANGTGTKPAKGYGLGLAITREIVRAHGGDIWVTSESGRGTSFVFTLPDSGLPARTAGGSTTRRRRARQRAGRLRRNGS
ncbi:MAG: HAMP domain-containing histidine kinase [Dehalococcoidia bacterium]|nr:HAMP domain-containing histidine kinase [Dehalococcoidia bacterium]